MKMESKKLLDTFDFRHDLYVPHSATLHRASLTRAQERKFSLFSRAVSDRYRISFSGHIVMIY